MARCVIFAAGDFFGRYERQDGDYIIAADAGYHHLENIGISPDMLLGDFDTIGEVPEHKNKKTFPKDKDYTDTELAIIEGVNLGYSEFIIYGALGGKRLEHTLCNIKMCESYTKKGYSLMLSDGNYYLTAIDSSKIEFSEDETGFISIFSMSESAKSVSIKGLKYELDDADIDSMNPTLCVSNEFIGKKAEISVKDGCIIIIWQRNYKNEA